MKSKHLRFLFFFLCGCMSMALHLGGCFLFIKMQVIDEHGYTSDLENIPGLEDENIISADVKFENDLFYSRTGWLNDWSLIIIGKFSPETTSYLLSKPNEIGFPSPRPSYEEGINIFFWVWPMKNIPEDIKNNLKLTQFQDSKNFFYSKIEDNMAVFEFKYKKYYGEKVFLLGKSGYFIIRVNHWSDAD